MRYYNLYKSWRKTISFILKPKPVVEVGVLIFALLVLSANPPNFIRAEEFSPLQEVQLPTTAELASTEYMPSPSFQEDLKSFQLQELERQFYTTLTGDIKIVDMVISYNRGRMSLDVLFAMMEKESSFNIYAINTNVDDDTGIVLSVDRGLFQLNSLSYPELSESDFFNLDINIPTGIGHIASDYAWAKRNLKIALYAYNAGRTKVEENRVPSCTYDYAEYIVQRSSEIALAKKQFIRRELDILNERGA